MKPIERILWAVVIILVDLVVFAIPLTAFVAAYIILARPEWFRTWISKLYETP